MCQTWEDLLWGSFDVTKAFNMQGKGVSERSGDEKVKLGAPRDETSRIGD